MLLLCTYIRESRLRTIIIAGIFVLQMCESYTARKFVLICSSLYRGIQAAEETKTSFSSSPKTNFIRNSIRRRDAKGWNSLQ